MLSRSVISDSLQTQVPLSMRILQASILECIAIFFSRGSSQPRDQTQVFHFGQIIYCLSHQGSPRTLEFGVAYPFSRGSSCPRNQTGNSFVAGGFFTSRTTREGRETCLSSFLPLLNRTLEEHYLNNLTNTIWRRI